MRISNSKGTSRTSFKLTTGRFLETSDYSEDLEDNLEIEKGILKKFETQFHEMENSLKENELKFKNSGISVLKPLVRDSKNALIMKSSRVSCMEKNAPEFDFYAMKKMAKFFLRKLENLKYKIETKIQKEKTQFYLSAKSSLNNVQILNMDIEEMKEEVKKIVFEISGEIPNFRVALGYFQDVHTLCQLKLKISEIEYELKRIKNTENFNEKLWKKDLSEETEVWKDLGQGLKEKSLSLKESHVMKKSDFSNQSHKGSRRSNIDQKKLQKVEEKIDFIIEKLNFGENQIQFNFDENREIMETEKLYRKPKIYDQNNEKKLDDTFQKESGKCNFKEKYTILSSSDPTLKSESSTSFKKRKEKRKKSKKRYIVEGTESELHKHFEKDFTFKEIDYDINETLSSSNFKKKMKHSSIQEYSTVKKPKISECQEIKLKRPQLKEKICRKNKTKTLLGISEESSEKVTMLIEGEDNYDDEEKPKSRKSQKKSSVVFYDSSENNEKSSRKFSCSFRNSEQLNLFSKIEASISSVRRSERNSTLKKKIEDVFILIASLQKILRWFQSSKNFCFKDEKSVSNTIKHLKDKLTKSETLLKQHVLFDTGKQKKRFIKEIKTLVVKSSKKFLMEIASNFDIEEEESLSMQYSSADEEDLRILETRRTSKQSIKSALNSILGEQGSELSLDTFIKTVTHNNSESFWQKTKTKLKNEFQDENESFLKPDNNSFNVSVISSNYGSKKKTKTVKTEVVEVRSKATVIKMIDDDFCAIGFRSGDIVFFNLEKNKCFGVLENCHDDEICLIEVVDVGEEYFDHCRENFENKNIKFKKFMNSNKIMITSAKNNSNNLLAWHLAYLEPIEEISGHLGRVTVLRGIGNSMMISGSEDKTLAIWDLQNPTVSLELLHDVKSSVTSLDYFQSSKTLCAVGKSGVILRYKLKFNKDGKYKSAKIISKVKLKSDSIIDFSRLVTREQEFVYLDGKGDLGIFSFEKKTKRKISKGCCFVDFVVFDFPKKKSKIFGVKLDGFCKELKIDDVIEEEEEASEEFELCLNGYRPKCQVVVIGSGVYIASFKNSMDELMVQKIKF